MSSCATSNMVTRRHDDRRIEVMAITTGYFSGGGVQLAVPSTLPDCVHGRDGCACVDVSCRPQYAWQSLCAKTCAEAVR